MLEIIPLIENVSVNLSENLHSFPSSVRPFVLTTCNFALRSSEFSLRFPIPTRVRNLVAVAQGRESFKPHVDTC
jgi:hypothetical protein